MAASVPPGSSARKADGKSPRRSRASLEALLAKAAHGAPLSDEEKAALAEDARDPEDGVDWETVRDELLQ